MTLNIFFKKCSMPLNMLLVLESVIIYYKWLNKKVSIHKCTTFLVEKTSKPSLPEREKDYAPYGQDQLPALHLFFFYACTPFS